MYPDRLKEQVVGMYIEGMSLSAISRTTEVKLGTVYSWIKKAQWALKVYQSEVEQMQISDENETVGVEKTRLDEMWSYVKYRKGEKRNSIWIWTAVCDEKFLFEVGSRGEETFWKLSEQLLESEVYYTDDYEVYRWLPCNQHVNGKEGKGETNWNEGKHSVLRDKLARLKRRTKAYTKSVWMLVASIALVAVKNGWT